MSVLEGVNIDDIQAIVASGQKDLAYGKYILLKFNDRIKAKSYLSQLLPMISKVSDGVGPDYFYNIAFTHVGIDFIENDGELRKSFQLEFIDGMNEPNRNKILGDEGYNGPEKWCFGKNRNSIHALLIIYGKEYNIDDIYRKQIELFKQYDIEIEEDIEANLHADYKEHFGFVDGISNPKIEGIHSKTPLKERQQLYLKPGEFILGYKNEYNDYSPFPSLGFNEKVKAKLSDIGISHSDGAFVKEDKYWFGKNGSYLVFRQLEQDVSTFWEYQLEHADNEAEAIKNAAKMMGRWPNGSPITKEQYRNNNGGENATKENDFLYFENDKAGLGCPIGAHIRRANPRDHLITENSKKASKQVTRKKQMIRRGRSYGKPVVDSMNTNEIIDSVRAKSVKGKRGLNFVALVSTISRQFEFVQSSWMQSPAFAGLRDENDPIIGTKEIEGKNERNNFTCPMHPFPTQQKELPSFVKMKGGQYFFLPGITAIKYLSK